MEINKNDVAVTLRYKDDKISIFDGNRQVGGVLEISSSELQKMYWGNDGKGILHIQVKE